MSPRNVEESSFVNGTVIPVKALDVELMAVIPKVRGNVERCQLVIYTF